MFAFIMTLLTGLFMGATIILSLAYIIDTRNKREIMRRAKIVATLMDTYGHDVHTAYAIAEEDDFVI